MLTSPKAKNNDKIKISFANALRRIMITEIPILAIEYVDFNENNSVLYNEVIAHRLGLLPLIFNPKDFKMKEEGKTGSEYEVVFAINKKGPVMVYAKDMKSSNPEVKPLFDNTPIVELFEGQNLKLEAAASLGFGKDHAKYQSANVYYRYCPVVNVNDEIKNADETVRICPKNALKIEGKKVSVTNDCDMCQECAKLAQPKGALEISGDPTKFLFFVESISGLKAEEIVLMAVDILKKKAKDFQKELKKLK